RTLFYILIVGSIFAAFFMFYRGYESYNVKWSTIEWTNTKSLPDDIVDIKDIEERKALFIRVMLPLILKANKDIEKDRDRIERMMRKKSRLSRRDRMALEGLAAQYLIDNITAKDDIELIHELLLRVDILPASLVLAQAAKESGWGTSRFARQANNVFGLRTLSGDGIVPFYRDGDDVFRVSVFRDLQSCVRFYMRTINTHLAYEELRYIRDVMATPYDSIVLAKGLSKYSERGEVYVKEIQDLITHNKLERYDRYRLEDSMGTWMFKYVPKRLKKCVEGMG
ncbi:MAG: glucosaminidase domain-containing protein, partial [Thermodesulfobacteriota bacterium]|nr:glucosaminidase domain-containing protein [Thermodesulfobacteriota bacterium]